MRVECFSFFSCKISCHCKGRQKPLELSLHDQLGTLRHFKNHFWQLLSLAFALFVFYNCSFSSPASFQNENLTGSDQRPRNASGAASIEPTSIYTNAMDWHIMLFMYEPGVQVSTKPFCNASTGNRINKPVKIYAPDRKFSKDNELRLLYLLNRENCLHGQA